MMIRHVLRLVLFALLTGAGCTTARRGQKPSTQISEPDNAFAEYVVGLRKSLLIARAQLDSMVAQLNRVSGDPSASSIARSTDLVKRIGVLDSAYRVGIADLLWVMNSSSVSVSTPSMTHSPLGLPPAPLLQPFADGEDWMLQTHMVFRTDKASALILIVPRGFVTDYASIPRPLRLLLPKTGAYGNAAIIHDYLYWRQDCTRAESDNIMAIAMMEAGVQEATLKAIQIGVRFGGQGSWDSNRRDRQSGLLRTVGSPFDQVPPGVTWDVYREWIHTHNGRSGVEYAVPQKVCAMGDSVKL